MRSHGRGTAQNFPDFAQNLKICVHKFKKIIILNSFTVYFFMFHTYFMIFSENFLLFLAQNFKTKVFTAPKKSTFRMSEYM